MANIERRSGSRQELEEHKSVCSVEVNRNFIHEAIMSTFDLLEACEELRFRVSVDDGSKHMIFPSIVPYRSNILEEKHMSCVRLLLGNINCMRHVATISGVQNLRNRKCQNVIDT